jgi:hypothetical protein
MHKINGRNKKKIGRPFKINTEKIIKIIRDGKKLIEFAKTIDRGMR